MNIERSKQRKKAEAIYNYKKKQIESKPLFKVKLEYFVSKLAYDSLSEFGYLSDKAINHAIDMQSYMERGMQDIAPVLYEEILGKEEDGCEPVGIILFNKHGLSDPLGCNQMTLCINWNNNTIYTKMLQPQKYYEYRASYYAGLQSQIQTEPE